MFSYKLGLKTLPPFAKVMKTETSNMFIYQLGFYVCKHKTKKWGSSDTYSTSCDIFWHFCDIFVTFLWHFCDIFVTFLWQFWDIFVTFLSWHSNFLTFYQISKFSQIFTFCFGCLKYLFWISLSNWNSIGYRSWMMS